MSLIVPDFAESVVVHTGSAELFYVIDGVAQLLSATRS
jgi:hypothetical protein